MSWRRVTTASRVIPGKIETDDEEILARTFSYVPVGIKQ
jgi:hypothetical protein